MASSLASSPQELDGGEPEHVRLPGAAGRLALRMSPTGSRCILAGSTTRTNLITTTGTTIVEKANQSERGKTDNDYRLDLCFEMEEYLIDEALTIPIYETPGRRLINDRIKLPLDDYKPAFGWGWMYAKVVD